MDEKNQIDDLIKNKQLVAEAYNYIYNELPDFKYENNVLTFEKFEESMNNYLNKIDEG